MITRILAPLDGSPIAEEVLPLLEDLAVRLRAQVYLVRAVPLRSVVMMGTVVDATLVAEQLEIETQEAKDYLSRLANAWKAKGIDARWEAISGGQGSVAASIIEYAHGQDVQLIAMCTHGRSGLGRLVFGSVADEVLRNSGVPVLLVKPSHLQGQKA